VPEGKDILDFIAECPEQKAHVLLEKLDRIEIKLAEISLPAEGLDLLMKTLKRFDIKMGIITRNTKQNAQTSLDKIDVLKYFPDECIIGRDEALPKPDPDGIFKLLESWKGTPDNTVMVGDYLYDLQAGKAAGTATVHVDKTRAFSWGDIADVKVRSLIELNNRFLGL
ncbi:HAD-IA family hydrolase, partial [bacterium]|nr:HAD-IA family hydrolase [bacterium]